MAKTEYTCAECGASVTVWGRNRSEANRLARWHESEGHLCSDCEAKRLAEKNRKAADANATTGLPQLTGSEKQIAWAETLRQKMLANARAYAPLMRILRDSFTMDATPLEDIPGIREEMRAAVADVAERDRHYVLTSADSVMREIGSAARYEKFLEIMARQTRASWWIDHHNFNLQVILESLKTEIDAAEAAETDSEVPAEEKALLDDAQAEALLKPAGEPLSTQIAEISLVGEEVRVIFAEKREDFRLLMRDMGFVWTISRWARRMGVTTGDAIDCLAETAHRIVAAGFLARLHDDEARARALSGQFTPAKTRWVSKNISGQFYGWFVISWARSDDFYAPARRLLGARYQGGKIYVPPGSVMEVADFAAQYDFALTPGAQEILAAHQAALAAGAVIANPRQGPQPVRIEESTIPPKLDPGTVGGDIDPSLREEG
jgi:DNA-directed RNA polymerase subunit RPC12/RpoP